MRSINHLLCCSKTGKSAILKFEIDDKYGKQTINFFSVKGWRKDLALKYLPLDSDKWNNDTLRVYVGLQVLKCARDIQQGLYFINIVKTLASVDINFWTNKFLTDSKTRNAWRSFYG